MIPKVVNTNLAQINDDTVNITEPENMTVPSQIVNHPTQKQNTLFF